MRQQMRLYYAVDGQNRGWISVPYMALPRYQWIDVLRARIEEHGGTAR